MVSFAGFNFKEKIFVSLAWIPKATVQVEYGNSRNDRIIENTVADSPLTPVLHESKFIDLGRVIPDLHYCKWEKD